MDNRHERLTMGVLAKTNMWSPEEVYGFFRWFEKKLGIANFAILADIDLVDIFFMAKTIF